MVQKSGQISAFIHTTQDPLIQIGALKRCALFANN